MKQMSDKELLRGYVLGTLISRITKLDRRSILRQVGRTIYVIF